MTVKTIVLKGAGIRKELIGASAITPGELVERTASNTVQAHSSAGAQAQRAWAVENEVVGEDIDDDYATLDTVLFEIHPPGSEIYGWITTDDITRGDLLVSNGDGSMKAVSTPGIVPTATGVITDDDSAASNGVAIYLHIDEKAEYGINTGHIESVTANDADAVYDVGADGPRIRINDDDSAASGGFQIYFDEDGTNADERWLATQTILLKDVFVITNTGHAIRIKYHATASSTGVALYFDDNASDEEARMLFISPTDAAGSFTTDDQVGLLAYTAPESVLAMALETVTNNGGGSNARMKMEVI